MLASKIGAISRQAVYDALGMLVERVSFVGFNPLGRQPATRIGSVTITTI